uniref:Uncharacterized protein n=1 Tax=Callithrix jacchus TaxID=9483 RepID=A0A8I3W3J5_CALJA
PAPLSISASRPGTEPSG